MSDVLNIRLDSFFTFKSSVKKILKRINKILNYKKPRSLGFNKFINLINFE